MTKREALDLVRRKDYILAEYSTWVPNKQGQWYARLVLSFVDTYRAVVRPQRRAQRLFVGILYNEHDQVLAFATAQKAEACSLIPPIAVVLKKLHINAATVSASWLAGYIAGQRSRPGRGSVHPKLPAVNALERIASVSVLGSPAFGGLRMGARFGGGHEAVHLL